MPDLVISSDGTIRFLFLQATILGGQLRLKLMIFCGRLMHAKTEIYSADYMIHII